MTLHLEKLNGFFLFHQNKDVRVKIIRSKRSTYLVLIEFVEGLGFDFLDGVVLARWDVFSLVDLGVFLS